MAYVTMKELLEAGVHFGHQTKRWNPKMKPYIFGARNGIYIVDLQRTVRMFKTAYDFVVDTVAAGKPLLFVGTKKQARDSIYEEANRCEMFYVHNRWLGGMLTNFQTIRQSIDRLNYLNNIQNDGSIELFPKKERLKLGKERVKLLNTKAKQMSALIDDILQYSMLGQRDAEKQQIDLKVVISEVVAGIDPPNHIEIAIENELPVLMCDKTHIVQAFQNLLGNAVKYMDKADGQIRVGCIEENGFWKFSVADNGPGIRKKYFNKIFQMFQTLSPRDGIKSTGIGLSVVKKIAEMNGGTAWVESEIGRGSTFFFTFAKKRCAANTACLSNFDSR